MSYKTDEEHSQPYVEEIKSSYESILKNIGEDTTRNGIVKTPERAAKAMQFLTQGYNMNPEKILLGAMFEEPYEDMVLIKDIELYSLCEHHMLPFFGQGSRWLYS